MSAYGRARIGYGGVVEGEIVDPLAVSAAIKECLRSAGIRAKYACLGVSNQKVVVRLVDLPFMQNDELAGAIQFQAQDYIPIPIEEAILSYERIGEYVTPSDEHMMEVLLVAAQSDMINNVVAAADGAGVRPERIDVTSFALARALVGLADVPFFGDEGAGAATCIVHITSGLTNILVVESGIPRFTRVSSFGGNQFTQAVANVLNVPFEEAEALKLEIGLPALDGSVTEVAGTDPQTVSSVQDTLEREANKFIAEVRRSLDYYITQATQAKHIERVVLAGNGSNMAHLMDYLTQGLQAQVVMGDPLQNVTVARGIEDLVFADRQGCAVAVGLAMEVGS